MNAAKLLDQVRALPPRERQRFLAAVRRLEKEIPTPAAKRSKRVEWPDVHERAKRIFGDRVLPNLVLLEREEEPA
jgi:phage-related protein